MKWWVKKNDPPYQLKRMAEVLGVTADYLLNDENDNGRRVVQMKDWELLEKIEKVDQMDAKDRETVKNLLDLAILKYSVKKLQAA